MSPRSGIIIGNWILSGVMGAEETWAPSEHCCHASFSHLCMVGPFLTSIEGNSCLCLYPLIYFSHLLHLSFFFFSSSIFYLSFYYLAMCLRVYIGDQNMICLIQSHLLSFLSEINISIEHSSGQKRHEGSLLMGTEVAWKGVLWKERRYMRSQFCLSPDRFRAAHSTWQPHWLNTPEEGWVLDILKSLTSPILNTIYFRNFYNME